MDFVICPPILYRLFPKQCNGDKKSIIRNDTMIKLVISYYYQKIDVSYLESFVITFVECTTIIINHDMNRLFNK
jgi:hypothetical protein